jgi:molybdate transport system substrate-binding protein
MKFRDFAVATTVSIYALAHTASAHAVNITFLCAEALQSSMIELLPDFQSASGHTVSIAYANIGTNSERVRKGEPADAVVLSPQQWDDLKTAGKILPNVRSVIGRIGIGVFVRKGERHPDISSVEALKRTLSEVRTIAVRDPKQGSPVGARVLALFVRLGLHDQLMPKVILTTDRPYEAVISGKAELGFSTMPEIAAAPNVDLVGSLPSEVQNFTTFIAAIPTNAKEVDAARQFVTFLFSPSAISVFRSKGIETATSP